MPRWIGVAGAVADTSGRSRPEGALADAHRPTRGHQQPNQGHQADGLRVQGHRLLLSQDQGRLPRKCVMNHKKARFGGLSCVRLLLQ